MSIHEDITLAVQAEARLPMAILQLVRVSVSRPSDYVREENDTYRLELCLTHRNESARACYRNRWSPHRFERIGDTFVLPPGEIVETKTEPTALQRSVVCTLQAEPLRAWFEGDLEWTDQRLEASLDIRNTTLQNTLLRLGAELENPGFAHEVMLTSLVGQAAVELGRYCKGIDAGAPRGGLAPWRLRLIEERLQEGLVPTLPELAQLCNLSIRALTRGFRVSKGSSVGEYVASTQVDRAKRLLTSGEPVKTVAYAVGFASPASFCSAFRRVTGETPGQFRNRFVGSSRH